jgi:hypothetical protein
LSGWCCGNAAVNGKAHTLAALLVMSTTHGARIEDCFDSTVTQTIISRDILIGPPKGMQRERTHIGKGWQLWATNRITHRALQALDKAHASNTYTCECRTTLS